MSSPLELLLEPRATLRVLEHIDAHPAQAPDRAQGALKVSHQTWYSAISRLESLGLVAPVRGPRRRKVKSFEITPEGERVLAKLKEVVAQVGSSRAGLEWELEHRPPLKGGARAGEVLCRLIEYAERRNDFAEMRRLEGVAKELGRPGEAHLAREVASFLQGRPKVAQSAGEAAIAELKPEGNTRSLRKAMMVVAACLEYQGEVSKPIRTVIAMRALARRAGDHEFEVDGWLIVGIMKSRLGHYADAVNDMEKALAIAKAHDLPIKRAKVLGNLCYTLAFVDEDRAMAMADEALRAARKVGATILIARAQTNRALFLAVRGRPDEARRAMREAKRLLAGGGEEKGAQMLEGWGRLVKQISRRRRTRYPIDWRAQAQSLARSQPTPAPEEQRE